MQSSDPMKAKISKSYHFNNFTTGNFPSSTANITYAHNSSRINIIKDSFSFRFEGGEVSLEYRSEIFNYDHRDNYRETGETRLD